MERDKEFLKSCELMDYSLLLIFFRKGHDASPNSNRKVSVVVRRESEGQGKVVMFEEIKEDNSKLPNIFGVSPSINAHHENEDIPDEKSNSILFDHFGHNNNLS